MRTSRAWIFLLFGVALAAATGVGLYQVMTATRQPATGAAATANVVVARVEIAPRTALTVEMLAVKAYPVDLVPPGSFTTVSDAVGRTAAVQIARAQPIVRDLLSVAGSPEVTSLAIALGRVMVAFPTTDPLTTAGLVAVGDHVDLIATVGQGSGDASKTTQTTVQDLEVVELITATKDQPQRPRALVFVVDHQTALVLKYLRDAQTTVDLVIRSRDETQLAKTTTVDLKYLTDVYGFKR